MKRRTSPLELAGALDQPPDRLQVEALGLEVLDQLDPRHVLGPVVAGPAADLGRRQQPARLVRADVAHGHAGALGELVDGQLGAPPVGGRRSGSVRSLTTATYALRCDIDPCNGYTGKIETPHWEERRAHQLHLRRSPPPPPAGGAALGQVAIATGAPMVATGVLLVPRHRPPLRPRAARSAASRASAERVSGLPGWAALPSAVAAVALIVALFGMYWDISLHIDNGRDAGPLANPAHYFILVGLFGIFAAGVLAIVLPDEERPARPRCASREGWYAPVGGVLIAACGAFSLIGFPLDDFWHRLFGQDVTLWGPTHLMLIGGAGLTLVGQAVLLAEGMRAARAQAARRARRPRRRSLRSRRAPRRR